MNLPAGLHPYREGMAKWWTLVAVCVATFMLLLDVTIVNVAVPSIEQGLDAGAAAVQWIVSGYALTFGLTLVAGGRLGVVVGRRRVFVGGLGSAIVASLLIHALGWLAGGAAALITLLVVFLNRRGVLGFFYRRLMLWEGAV